MSKELSLKQNKNKKKTQHTVLQLRFKLRKPRNWTSQRGGLRKGEGEKREDSERKREDGKLGSSFSIRSGKRSCCAFAFWFVRFAENVHRLDICPLLFLFQWVSFYTSLCLVQNSPHNSHENHGWKGMHTLSSFVGHWRTGWFVFYNQAGSLWSLNENKPTPGWMQLYFAPISHTPLMSDC